jgi:hypothetical protein
MSLKIFIILLLVTFIGADIPTRAQEQEVEDTTRGSFLNTRPVKSGNGTKAKALLPRRRTGAGKSAGRNRASPNESTAIGLGYTIYQCDANGRAVSVDPSREFKSGDAIRITLEPNIDGYLYIFYTENDSEPEMIFPDVRLHKGENAIRAHVPYEVPSSLDPDPNLRWFFFDDKPATERVYIVVTRQPISDVPVGEKLVNYCQTNSKDYPLRPSAMTWTQVKTNVNAPVHTSKNKTHGRTQNIVERESITRGFGLSKAAPPPSVIRMNTSSNTEILVTLIELIHK